MIKGIIAAPARFTGGGSLIGTDRDLTSQELRYFLLYWDKVVIPTTDLLHLSIPEEKEFLSTGVIERPRFRVPDGTFDGSGIAKAHVAAQTSIARDLIESDKTTDWVLHQIGEDLILPTDDTFEQQSIRVDLVNLLPVPDAGFPIPDILEFKERRSQELLHLHSSLDNFYLEILSSPDPSLKSKAVVTELKTAIANLSSVSGESWKSTKKFDISAELNISGSNMVSAAAAGAVVDFYSNLFTMPVATIAGAVGSMIKAKCKYSKSFKPAKDKQVLSYLAKAHEEKVLC